MVVFEALSCSLIEMPATKIIRQIKKQNDIMKGKRHRGALKILSKPSQKETCKKQWLPVKKKSKMRSFPAPSPQKKRKTAGPESKKTMRSPYNTGQSQHTPTSEERWEGGTYAAVSHNFPLSSFFPWPSRKAPLDRTREKGHVELSLFRGKLLLRREQERRSPS